MQSHPTTHSVQFYTSHDMYTHITKMVQMGRESNHALSTIDMNLGTAISGRQHLWSAPTGTLLVPCVWTANGQRSFAVNKSATWNCLPPALWSPDLSDSALKRALKMHLFSNARRHWDVFMILATDINIQTYLFTYLGSNQNKPNQNSVNDIKQTKQKPHQSSALWLTYSRYQILWVH